MWLAAVRILGGPGIGGLSTFLLAVFGALGAMLTALVTYFVARHVEHSGDIKTSTAESLWNESNAIRETLSARLEAAEIRGDQQEKVIALAREEAAAARQEAAQWRQKVMQMESDARRMKRQITTLQRQVRELRGRK